MLTLVQNMDADGTSAETVWTQTANGSQYSIIAAFGDFGGGTAAVQHEVNDGNWIQIAALTTGATTSWAMKIVPNGNYRVVLSGATSPELSVYIKAV